MTNNPIWKIWLYTNFLTKDVDNDYIAEVSTVGNTLRNEDIARQIVKERSEIRYETMLGILNERDAVVRDFLLGGSSVQDNNVRLAPRITGSWTGTTPLFDPRHHKVTFDATVTDEMRAALNSVHVEILGVKEGGGARIGLVTDTITGKTDGTVTPGDDIIIEGYKIKIAPDKDDNTVGVFFVNAEGTAARAPSIYIANNPKKLIIRVPNLTTGTYTLQVVTRYSDSSTLLKANRTIEYGIPLVVL
jgi:hypothetical protein